MAAAPRGPLREILTYTAPPLASLGSRFLLFGSASSLTSLYDFMLPPGDKLMRASLNALVAIRGGSVASVRVSRETPLES
jgi:hypothetical protein